MSEADSHHPCPPGTLGFEFELLIPMTTGAKYGEIKPPSAKDAAIAQHQQLPFTLKRDTQDKMSIFTPIFGILKVGNARQPQPVSWPKGEKSRIATMTIPEIVTDVYNSNMPARDVRNSLEAIATWAEAAFSSGLEERKPLSVLDPHLKPLSDEPLTDIYLGPIVHPEGDAWVTVRKNAADIQRDMNAGAYVHQTYALPLHRVLDEFDHLFTAASTVGSAATRGDTGISDPLKYACDRKPVDETLDELGVTDVRARADFGGFLALIRYYARTLSINHTAQGLNKNHPSLLLFYKSDLADVRLGIEQRHPSVTTALKADLAATKARTKLLPGLKGTLALGVPFSLLKPEPEDLILAQYKNEYSKALKPGGDALGVVVENRRVTEVVRPQNGSRFLPEEWPDLAATLHTRLAGYWA